MKKSSCASQTHPITIHQTPSMHQQAASNDATESWSTIDSASVSQPQQQSPNPRSKRRSMRSPPRHHGLEEVPSTDSGLSWMKRVSWLRTTSNRNNASNHRGGEPSNAT